MNPYREIGAAARRAERSTRLEIGTAAARLALSSSRSMRPTIPARRSGPAADPTTYLIIVSTAKPAI